MIGHRVKLTRTNSRGVVWLCECGEIGNVTPMVGVTEELSRRSRRRLELTEELARIAHGRHLYTVCADVARQSDDELARIGRAIPLANQALQRRGRWGHP